MSTSFVVRLYRAIQDFNLQEAETLSDVLHEAEKNGAELSLTVEDLWSQLTAKIQEARKG